MNIDKKVEEHLDKDELKELGTLLDQLETKELYASGYAKISGGFASATAYDLEEGGDYDDDLDKEIDLIEIELESGECNESYTNSQRVCGTIPRHIATDKELPIEERIASITF